MVNAINLSFLDFAIKFFKEIVNAKMNSDQINLEWYKKHFVCNNEKDPAECVICAGMNKKTITNIYGTSNKKVILDVAKTNFEYLSEILDELSTDSDEGFDISIKISYKDITVELSLTESLLVINALATKKISNQGRCLEFYREKSRKTFN